ncbi:cytochrome c biogenesis protein CcsA [uncultured Helicobacter sp.]|uniref:cytochrome c biogenesis protein n=1 Tax=uncultured Helicobacter sp. TaxID=175537 RepID=UPI001C3ADDB9|nr:cytochrome c biogenesis protein CcsA [Candidatus Helicobacter avicola]
MKTLRLLFANMPLVLILIALYAIACGVATFIESAHGSPAARASVYGTWWFEILHLWLLLSLIGCFVLSKAWQRKKYASLMLHFSFIIIILGAGITRYFGFEGSMPIQEHTSSNVIFSSEPYVLIQGFERSSQSIEGVEIALNSTRSQTYDITFFGKQMTLVLQNIGERKNEFGMPYQALDLSLEFAPIDLANHTDSATTQIFQSQLGDMPSFTRIDKGEYVFFAAWGSKAHTLPFSIYLEDFVLDRYPGSNAPSSYASYVQVQDPNVEGTHDAVIFMNNVLDYGGYRFFQSSYFPDESGTILSVNNDPGKIPTYVGYGLLIIGCIWLLFDKSGRFMSLARFVRSKSFIALVALGLCCVLPQSSYATESSENFTPPTQEEVQTLITNIKAHSSEFSEEFATLLVQDSGGRIKPIDTIASEYIHKITGKDGFLGLSNMQVLLGITMYPEYFRHIKMIKTKSPKLREILGVDKEQKYIAAIDAYTNEGGYILRNYVEAANQKPLKEQDVFDKDVIEVNERLYLFGLIYSGQTLRVFPSTQAQDSTWYDIQDALHTNKGDETALKELLWIVSALSHGFVNGVLDNDWKLGFEGLQKLQDYQKSHGSELVISPDKVKAEIFLNKSRIFEKLAYPYVIVGVVLFVIVLFAIISGKPLNVWVSRVSWILIGVCFVLHTLGLGLRWYVSGHAPWSNAYESMLYIAWAGALAGVVFFRKSALALCAASFLAGITLIVANLGDMNPQIGNLVPVLKSYWLNIHVSVITASYGFLGLCFVLGCITLLLFILRSPKRAHIDDSILSLSAINEMSMILGLFLLTIGNFLGAIWANESWGRYWGWDPKETWALISIGVYAIILHLRFLGFVNMPFVFGAASVLGFLSVLMTYFGVNYFLTGMHSYASGEAAQIPWYIYLIVAGMIALIIAASPKRSLQMPKV